MRLGDGLRAAQGPMVKRGMDRRCWQSGLTFMTFVTLGCDLPGTAPASNARCLTRAASGVRGQELG